MATNTKSAIQNDQLWMGILSSLAEADENGLSCEKIAEAVGDNPTRVSTVLRCMTSHEGLVAVRNEERMGLKFPHYRLGPAGQELLAEVATSK